MSTRAELVAPPSGWQPPYALRALRHRNFCLFFVGQFVSRTGFWMQSMAQGWLVYRLSQSSFMLGLVAFAGQFPALILGLFAGVVADCFDRYRVVMFTQSLAMLQALTLGILTLGGWITVKEVFFLAFFYGQDRREHNPHSMVSIPMQTRRSALSSCNQTERLFWAVILQHLQLMVDQQSRGITSPG